MPEFGRASRRKLATVHPDLRRILNAAIKDCPIDFTIVWAFRNEEEQNRAFALGNSTKKWPESKHNTFPCLAVDIAPWYPEDPHLRWDEEHLDEFGFVAGWITKVAHDMGFKLRWGGPWKLNDCGHLELVL